MALIILLNDQEIENEGNLESGIVPAFGIEVVDLFGRVLGHECARQGLVRNLLKFFTEVTKCLTVRSKDQNGSAI